MDTVIPIVFPDYLIAVTTAPTQVDLVPWFTFDDFTVGRQSAPMLGHAGVLFFNSAGTTKYYEYGRYDPPHNLGKVRRVRIPDLTMEKGQPSQASLKSVLNAITIASGQGGRIQAVYIEVPGMYPAMLTYAETRERENTNPKRKPYDLVSNSCIHFVKGVVEAAGVSTPWMLDPRPNSYIGEFRDDFADLDFDPKTRELTISP